MLLMTPTEERPEVPGLEAVLRAGIAQELNRKVGQALDIMLIDLEQFKAAQFGRQEVIRQVERYQLSTQAVLDNLREMVLEMAPEAAVDLAAMLEQEFGALHLVETGTEVAVVVAPGWPRLSGRVAAQLLRIAQEAVGNARRHGGADHLRINLAVTESNDLEMTIHDNGSGINEESLKRPGMGIRGMEERAGLLGGWLAIWSGAGQGTTVRAVIPKESL